MRHSSYPQTPHEIPQLVMTDAEERATRNRRECLLIVAAQTLTNPGDQSERRVEFALRPAVERVADRILVEPSVYSEEAIQAAHTLKNACSVRRMEQRA